MVNPALILVAITGELAVSGDDLAILHRDMSYSIHEPAAVEIHLRTESDPALVLVDLGDWALTIRSALAS